MSRPLPWFRMYSELINDFKVNRVMRKTNLSKIEVIGAWSMMLCLANDSNDRGRLLIGNMPLTNEDLSDLLAVDENTINTLLTAFDEQEMLYVENDIICISSWEKRNPPSDSAANKQKAYRDRRKSGGSKGKNKALRNGNVTGGNDGGNGYALEGDKEIEGNKERDTEGEEEINFTPTPSEQFTSQPENKPQHHKFGKMQIGMEFAGGNQAEIVYPIAKQLQDYCDIPNWRKFTDNLWDAFELADVWPDEQTVKGLADKIRLSMSDGKCWPSQIINEVRGGLNPNITPSQPQPKKPSGNTAADAALSFFGGES